MKFADLGLSDKLLQAVTEAGYDEPTPIQAEAIPTVLMMRDLIGIAQTGTGKTAGFVLPMIDVLATGRRRALMPRSLILEPTRELAAQVGENFVKYGKNHNLKMALLIGGVQMGDQVKALNEGVDVLIATPGRLMDLFERGKILLNGCELLVIDEADRMLDMGFIPDIETICSKLPESRQTMLFSATMPPAIEKLSKKFLNNPKRIEVSRAASTNKDITAFKIGVKNREKFETLSWLLKNDMVETAIVFANKKTTVRELNKKLQSKGFSSGEIHGDIDQASRIAELERFKSGEVSILVASDVAARGLDIKGVTHVFNYDTPWHPDDYVHRIGRTGRAGAKGRAFTFVAEGDGEAIANVEKLTGSEIKSFGKSDVRVELPKPSEKPEKKQPSEEHSSDRDSGSNRGRNTRGQSDRGERSERSRNDGGRNDRTRNDHANNDREAEPRGERSENSDRGQPRREQSDGFQSNDRNQQGERGGRGSRPAPNTGRNARDENHPRRYRDYDPEPVPAGEWNGPKPGFLEVSALV